MGRELQKRKNRSGVAKIRQKPKSKKKILSNPIIAANWCVRPKKILSHTQQPASLTML